MMAVAQPETLFSEIIDFLASTPTSDDILQFKPSERLERRLSELLERNRTEMLTVDEREELEEFLRMNHFMNMLKIRMRERLQKP